MMPARKESTPGKTGLRHEHRQLLREEGSTPSEIDPYGEGGIWVELGAASRKLLDEKGNAYLARAGLLARARCVELEGRVLIRELVIQVNPELERLLEVGPRSINAADLRDIHLKSADPQVRILYSDLLPKPARRRLQKPPPTRKRTHKDDGFHAEVAIRYLNTLAAEPRAPIARMTEEYIEEGWKIDRTNVRDWVHAARTRGYLTKGKGGHSGAAATRKLLRYLEKGS